jgi:hypothetical protein
MFATLRASAATGQIDHIFLAYAAIVWEVRRGVHDEIVSGLGGMTPLPPFLCWAFSPSEKDGSPRRHSAFFGGEFSPPEEGLGK